MRHNTLYFALIFISGSLLPINLFSQNTLKEEQGWDVSSLSNGIIWYQYDGYYRLYNSFQIVNVLEIDLSDPEFQISVKYLSGRDSLSRAAKREQAIAGINGTYELDASFLKSAGTVFSEVELSEGHLRYWKHEGALFYSPDNNNATINYGNNASYLANTFPEIISGAPVLIDDYQRVGESFVGDISGINLNALEYEDYRRHQGVRHPRTAVALTESNKMLLITVDGRVPQKAEGMNAAELTGFLARYFDPQYALNVDGGGSTTMWLSESNLSNTGVVNYPSDNKIFDHYGQRRVTSFILVKKRLSDDNFAGGQGTISDPYTITTAAHVQSMHDVDYTNPVYFKLNADVDMAGIAWEPLNYQSPYSNHIHFDGNGHIIKNLTSKNYAYGSFFGVLCGSCKNLGIINADIESSNGGGIIAGYAGLKGPGAPTGKIEGCYTTGRVVGTDAVGGIVGNVGKPNEEDISYVKNCYSTAEVLANRTIGYARAGGIAGIVYEKGIVENSYATGEITSASYGAGGIVGWTDSDITGCVAMNSTISTAAQGNIGRIAAVMGEVSGNIAQGSNCWGLDNIVLSNAGTILSEADLITGEVTVGRGSYDGASKTKEYLSKPLNYFSELSWDFASEENVWSQTMSNDFPIFQWLFNRADYKDIDGHHNVDTSVDDKSSIDNFYVWSNGKSIHIKSNEDLGHVRMYSISGKLVYGKQVYSNSTSLSVANAGVYVIVVAKGNKTTSRKAVIIN